MDPRSPSPSPLPADPRALDLAERRAACQRLHAENRLWLDRLTRLAEPRPERDFPAFLLATPAFRQLAEQLETATSRRDLSTATADEVDRFVDAYRYYLRTCAGEDPFAGQGRRAS